MREESIKEQVFMCVSRVCSTGVDKINEFTDIRDFGADSLDSVELILDIEDALGIDIQDKNIKNIYFVHDVLKAVFEALESNR